MIPRSLFSCLVLLLVLFTPHPFLYASPAEDIPESLKPWIPWVEHQDKTRFCPSRTGSPLPALCIWPHTLKLDLHEKGGTFSMDWELFAASPIPLPGEGTQMPRDVRVNGKAHPLLMEKGLPVLYLTPGKQRIEGRFLWPRIPDTLKLPPEIAQIEVRKNQSPLTGLLRDEEGRLWFRAPPSRNPRPAEPEHTSLRIYRKIQDGHPLEMETRIELSVSGEPRQEILPVPLPEKAVLVQVDSPLPLKPSMADGLVLDVRPGNFTLRLVHLLSGSENNLSVPGRKLEELWVFVPRPELRAAELQGGKALDPRQTSLPPEWKSWAAYAMNPEASPSIHIRESRTEPAEERLHLKRDIWLDFNGKGATVRDQLSGTLQTRSYLGMRAEGPLLPGRITWQEQDRLITLQDGLQGIELPPGSLALTSLSRMDTPLSGKALPLGWQTAMEDQDITLHLPPGWHLATLKGGQTAERHSLFSRWTLLDFFFLVLLSGAALKIWGLTWGLAFALSIAFFHHSFPLPLPFWFSLAATAALGRYFRNRHPRPLALTLLSGIHILLLLGAGLVALPYAADQIRTALYPQLENPAKFLRHTAAPRAVQQASLFSEAANEMEQIAEKGLRYSDSMDMAGAPPMVMKARKAEAPRIPPVTQTGPGEPSWKWRSIPVQTGFAGPEHSLTFFLIPPLAASLAAFLRVGLMVLVLGRLAAGFPYALPGLGKTTGLALALVLLSLSPLTRAQADFPPESLLRELKERLRTREACFPDCGRSGPSTLTLDRPDSPHPALSLEMEIHAGSLLAFPLPVTDLPLPGPAFLLNGEKPPVLRWEGKDFVALPPGIHTLRMTASLPGSPFRLDFPLNPDTLRLHAPGWRVEGLGHEGRIREMLLFRPEGEKKPEILAEEPEVLPFVRVHRSIRRDREWEVRTTLTRSYPGTRPGRIRIPVLAGETILREGLTVRDGHVELAIPAYGQRFTWTSRLPEQDSLQLRMAETLDFTEFWEIQGGTDRHLQFSGTTAPPRATGEGLLWHPLPGEVLNLSFAVMPPAPGSLLTGEKLSLKLEAGKERRRLHLEATIRSGKALHHPMQGPEKGILQEIRINGREHPLPREGEALLLDLRPGSHTLEMRWELPAEKPLFFLPRFIRMPALDLGMPTVNILQEIQLDKKQWLLWTYGPLLGPGVRIWGWIVLVLTGCLLLALKGNRSPLRTRDWLLLGLGLVPLSPLAILLMVAGFFIVQWRSTRVQPMGSLHNLWQCGFGLLLFTMALILLAAVRNGLLGVPDMQIAGNGSTSQLLRWTADRSRGIPPGTGVLLLPLFIWRLLMFAWALWLAARILSWAPWAWKALTTGPAWQGKPKKDPQDTGLRLDLPQEGVKKEQTPDTGPS